MRYILTFAVMYTFLNGYAQLTINGKIRNYDGKSKVFYNPTIDGVITAYATSYHVTPNSNGSFKITYRNKGFGTVQVYFREVRYSFFHSENSEINFVIDQAKISIPKQKETDHSRLDHIRDSVKQAATISLDGDYATVNRFNNRAIRTSTLALTVDGCDFSKLIKEAGTPAKAIRLIDSLTHIELDQIKDLDVRINAENSNHNPVTNDVKEFLENEVRSFYGSIFLNAMSLKRYEQVNKLKPGVNIPYDIYNREWERLVENFFVDASRHIKPAANSFEYNEFILNMVYATSDYRTYDFEPLNTSDDKMIVERLLNPDLKVLDSLHLLDPKAIFAYKLHNLSRFLNTQTFYSPVLLYAVNELKSTYPNSQHISYFEPQIEKLKAYLRTMSTKYDKAEIIETNYLRFSDLLETFKGQNILVDVWATWCGPCVEDFNYKSMLEYYIEQGKIVTLYISIDKPIWEKKWKENMKFNQLEGYHVLANDALIIDMWKYLGGTQGAIPRYALIDKKGDLFLKEAARPSQREKFVKQIESLLLK